jgi:2'-5' RNA ligase
LSTIRVFTALELPIAVTHHLRDCIQALQRVAARVNVRWVRPEGIHLTLKFYGEVPEAQIPELQQVVANAATKHNPLRLSLNGLGGFPNLKRPRVIWAGLAGQLAELAQLQQAVERGSEAFGFAPEARSFSPHLTLGRVNGPLRPADQQALTHALATLPPLTGPGFALDALSLIRSELQRGGAVYTPLFTAHLVG